MDRFPIVLRIVFFLWWIVFLFVDSCLVCMELFLWTVCCLWLAYFFVVRFCWLPWDSMVLASEGLILLLSRFPCWCQRYRRASQSRVLVTNEFLFGQGPLVLVAGKVHETDNSCLIDTEASKMALLVAVWLHPTFKTFWLNRLNSTLAGARPTQTCLLTFCADRPDP